MDPNNQDPLNNSNPLTAPTGGVQGTPDSNIAPTSPALAGSGPVVSPVASIPVASAPVAPPAIDWNSFAQPGTSNFNPAPLASTPTSNQPGSETFTANNSFLNSVAPADPVSRGLSVPPPTPDPMAPLAPISTPNPFAPQSPEVALPGSIPTSSPTNAESPLNQTNPNMIPSTSPAMDSPVTANSPVGGTFDSASSFFSPTASPVVGSVTGGDQLTAPIIQPSADQGVAGLSATSNNSFSPIPNSDTSAFSPQPATPAPQPLPDPAMSVQSPLPSAVPTGGVGQTGVAGADTQGQFFYSTEAAPTDLSHLMASSPNGLAEPVPTSQPENLVVPTIPGNESNQVVASGGESHGFPKVLIFVGILVLLLAAGGSAYFILGIGKGLISTTTSLPVEQQPLTNPPQTISSLSPTPINVVAPIASSSGFGNLNSGGATNSAMTTPAPATTSGTSALEILTKKQTTKTK